MKNQSGSRRPLVAIAFKGPFSVTMRSSVQSHETPNAVLVIDGIRRAAMNPLARAQHSARVRVPAGGVDER
jgi:hypothetical protein